MDQKLMVHFEVVKNDRVYRLEVASGAPLGELYDSLHEMLTAVLEMSKKANDNAKQAQPKEEIEPELV